MDSGKKILVVVLMGMLMLPFLQRQFALFPEAELHGYFEPTEPPAWDLGQWFEGKLQDSLVMHANSTIGFRNSFFRLHNQIYFSLFGIAKANGVILGKENFLYDREHIKAYLGKDYIGDSTLDARFTKLKDLVSIWKRKGIQFQLVLAPDKATAVPEYLPDGTPKPSKITNYSAHVARARQDDIHLLDLAAWFKIQKQKDTLPLYPSGGIHWSNYCATLAADTLIGEWQKLTGQQLNRFHILSLRHADQEEGEDADVSRGMNLIFPLASKPAVYPKLIWENHPKKLKILTIGDSFFFYAYTNLLWETVEENHFFFYFNELHRAGQPDVLSRKDIDLLKEIESKDIIQIYSSTSNLPRLGWGFIDAAWEIYFDESKRAPYLERIKTKIRNSPEWLEVIVNKAATQGISVDAALQTDAIWILQNARQK